MRIHSIEVDELPEKCLLCPLFDDDGTSIYCPAIADCPNCPPTGRHKDCPLKVKREDAKSINCRDCGNLDVFLCRITKLGVPSDGHYCADFKAKKKGKK